MRAKLHPYQDWCVAWLSEHPYGALLLDMGLGKTLIVLTALVDLMALGEIDGKVLVIAPTMTARHTWKQEAAKWDHTAGLRFSLVLGDAHEREGALCRNADVYVINRENVVWLTERYTPGTWPFQTVIIDELSSFKSRQAKRFKALRRMRTSMTRVWGLTGTPAPNGLMDLWAEIYLLDLGERLGRTIGGYRERYFRPGRSSGHVVYDWLLRPGAEDAIYRRIADVTVSMRAKDELQLPGRVDNTVEVELPPAAKKAYHDLERDQVLTLDETTITAGSAGIVAGKLCQAAGGAVYDEDDGWHVIHTAKFDALAAILEEAQGQPVLVFHSFRHELERIRARFPDAEVLGPPGTVERWNAGEIPLLLAHPASCGHGLNLQAGGHIVVWYSPPWSLELYQQANARLDRQGQTETVIVHHLVAKGTIDERVMDVLAGKGTLQEEMLDMLKGMT